MDEHRKELEISIENGRLASELESCAGWTSFAKPWLVQSRDAHDADIKSSKFISDHEGYLAALASFNAFDGLVRLVELTQKRATDAKKELDEVNGSAQPN